MHKFLFIFLLFWASLGYSQEFPKAQEIKAAQNAEGGVSHASEQKQSTNPTPVTLPTPYSDFAEGKSIDKTGESKQEGAEFWHVLGYTLKITDTLLVAFTFLLFLATLALWWATRRLVKGAEKTAEQQLRAYLSVDASEIRKFGFDQPPEGWVTLKNCGGTPAYQMKRRANIAVITYPATEELAGFDWSIENSRSDLGPNSEIYFGPIAFDRPLTSAETAAVETGKAAIYLWGEVRYRDAFKRRRTTKFRFFHRGNGSGQYNTVPTVHDTKGNRSD